MAEKELEKRGEDVRAMLEKLAPAAENIMKGVAGLEIIDARTARAVDLLKVRAEGLDKELPKAENKGEKQQVNLEVLTRRAREIEERLTRSGVDDLKVGGRGYRDEAGSVRGLLTGALSEALEKPQDKVDVAKVEQQVKEAEAKTVALSQIIVVEQNISEAPSEDRSRLVGALRSGFSDFGKPTQQRGELILEVADTYAQNQKVLNPDRSEQQIGTEGQTNAPLSEVAQKVRTQTVDLAVHLGEGAKKGVEFSASALKEARDTLSGIRNSISKLLEFASNFRADHLNRFVGDLLALQNLSGLSEEYKKAVGSLYEKLKKLVESVGKKEKKLSDREYADIDEEMKSINAVADLLSKTPSSVRGTLSAMYGRMLAARTSGKPEEAKIHAYIALQYLTADKDKRKELDDLSTKLGNGKITAAEACNYLGRHIAGKLYSALDSIHPSLRKYINKFTSDLHSDFVSVSDLEKAVSLLGLVKTMRTLLSDATKESKQEILLMFGRALFGFENGLPMEGQMQQLALARTYLRAERLGGEEGRKLMQQIRSASEGLYSASQLELVALKMKERGAKLTDVLKEVFPAAQATALSQYSLEQLTNQAQTLTMNYGAFVESAYMYVDLSEKEKGATADGEKTLYKRALGFLQNILDRISNRDFPAAEEIRKVASLKMFFFGSKEQLFEYFVYSEPKEKRDLTARLLSPLENSTKIFAKAKKQPEYERNQVFGLYTLALESLLQNQLGSAEAQIMSAQAYLGASGAQRAVLVDYGRSDFNGTYSIELHGPVTGTTFRYRPTRRSEDETKYAAYIELSRQNALASAKDPATRNNLNAYFDMATILFLRHDIQGAELVLNTAQLYGEASKERKNKDDKEVARFMAFAKELLGDYSNTNPKFLLGEQNSQKGNIPKGLVGEAISSGKKLAEYTKDIGLVADKDNRIAPAFPAHLAFIGKAAPDKRFDRLANEVTIFRLTLLGSDLEERAEKMLGKGDVASRAKIEKRYENERKRLEILAQKEPAGLNRDRLLFEAERVDYRKMEARIEDSRKLYRAAIAEVQKAREEGKEISQQTITLLNLSVSAFEALNGLHTSIGTIRTAEREKGRMHLERAAVAYLEMGTGIATKGRIERSKMDDAAKDMGMGMYLFREQQQVQRYAEALAVDIKRQKEINEANHQRNLVEEEILSVPTSFGADVERRKTGKLVSKTTIGGKPVVQYDKRKKQLERAEALLASGRVLEAAQLLNTARLGIRLDRMREQNELRDKNVYGKVEKRKVGDREVVVGYDYDSYVKHLDALETRLDAGSTKTIERDLTELDRSMRFGVATAALLQQKQMREQMIEGAQNMAKNARNLGKITYEERVAQKKQDLEALNSQEEAVALMHEQGGPEKLAKNADRVLEYLKKTPDPENALMDLVRQGHADNLVGTRDVYVLLDAYYGSWKTISEGSKIDYSAVLAKEGEEKAFEVLSSNSDDFRVALSEVKRRGLLSDRLLSVSEVQADTAIAAKRVSEFNRTYQAAISLYDSYMKMARYTDRVERERGASKEVSLMWNQALINLGAAMALSESEDALQKAKENEWEIRLPEVSGVLRDEVEGYIPLNSIHQARFLMAEGKTVLLPQIVENSMEAFLKLERGMSVDTTLDEMLVKELKLSTGQFDERDFAKQYTRLLFANSGYTYSNNAWKELDINPAEQAVLAQALHGGFGESLERYMEIGVVSKGITTEEERKTLYASIMQSSMISYSVAEQIIDKRLSGEKTEAAMALELMRHFSAGSRRYYEINKADILAKESTERGIKGFGMFAVGTLGVATGFGAEVGLVLALHGIHELAGEERRGGGLDQMYRANQVGTVVQVAGAALGFLGGVAGTTSRIASELVLAGRTTGILGRFGMAFAEGTKLTTYINVPIMIASFGSDVVNIGLSIGAYSRGEMGLLELVSSGLSPFQTIVQTGGSRIRVIDPTNRLWTERSLSGSAFRAGMLLGLGQTHGQILRHSRIAAIVDTQTAKVEGDKIHASLSAPKREQFDVMAKAIGIDDPHQRLLALKFTKMGLDNETTAAMMIDVGRSPEAARLVQAYAFFRDPQNNKLKLTELIKKFKEIGLTDAEIDKFVKPKAGEELGKPELTPKEALKILGENTFKAVKLNDVAQNLSKVPETEKLSKTGLDRARAMYEGYVLHSQGKLTPEEAKRLGLPNHVVEKIENTAHKSPQAIAKEILAEAKKAVVLDEMRQRAEQARFEKEREPYANQFRDSGKTGAEAKQLGRNTYSAEHAKTAVETAHAAATLLKKLDVGGMTDEKLVAEISKILPNGGTKEAVTTVLELLKDNQFIKAANQGDHTEQVKIAAHRSAKFAAEVSDNSLVDAIWHEKVAPILERSSTKPSQIYERAGQLRREGEAATKIAKDLLERATEMPNGPEQEATLKLAQRAETEAKVKGKLAGELEAEAQKRENEHKEKSLQTMNDEQLGKKAKEVADGNGLNHQAVEERAKQLREVLKIGRNITDEQAKEHGFENAAEARKFVEYILDKPVEKALDVAVNWGAQNVAEKEGKLISAGGKELKSAATSNQKREVAIMNREFKGNADSTHKQGEDTIYIFKDAEGGRERRISERKIDSATEVAYYAERLAKGEEGEVEKIISERYRGEKEAEGKKILEHAKRLSKDDEFNEAISDNNTKKKLFSTLDEMDTPKEIKDQIRYGNLGTAQRLAEGGKLKNMTPEQIIDVVKNMSVSGADLKTARTAFLELSPEKQQQIVDKLNEMAKGFDEIEQRLGKQSMKGGPDASALVLQATAARTSAVDLRQQLAFLHELRAMNGTAGRAIERMYGLHPGILSALYLSTPEISEARAALNGILKINSSTDDNGALHVISDNFMTMMSGDLAIALGALYAGSRIAEIKAMGSLNPVYMITMEDSQGKQNMIFAKPGDHLASRVGASNIADSGIAVPQILISRPEQEQKIARVYKKAQIGEPLTASEKTLVTKVDKVLERMGSEASNPIKIKEAIVEVARETAGLHGTLPDGQLSKYALFAHLGQSAETPLSIEHNGVAHRFALPVVAVSDFTNIYKNDIFMSILSSNPRAVGNILGHLQAVSILLGASDAHAGNSWIIARGVDNPTPERISALKSKENQIVTDEQGRKIIMKVIQLEDGRYMTIEGGRIDTDDSSGWYQAINTGGQFDFNNMLGRNGSPYVMHRIFTSLARAINAHLIEEAKQTGVPPMFVTAADVVNRLRPYVIEGVEGWRNTIGQTPDYATTIESRYMAREGDAVGAGGLANTALSKDDVHELNSQGSVRSDHFYANGQAFSILDREGRVRLVANGEGAGIADDHPLYSAMPENKTMYLVRINNEVSVSGQTIEFGGNRFALYDKVDEIPQSIRDRRIRVRRNDNDLTTGPGFGAETGISTTAIGAIPMFRSLLGIGSSGLAGYSNYILNQIYLWEKAISNPANAPDYMKPVAADYANTYNWDRLPWSYVQKNPNPFYNPIP